MNVCEVLLDILAENGVKQIFGIPGDAINALIEAVRKQDAIRFIHVVHEEAGAFAASAQAKLTGQLAVCVGTAGPGAIHLLNGLYDAKKDHAPVLAITGQVVTGLMGTEAHQEVDLQSLFSDVAVFNQTVMSNEQMPVVAMMACQMALAERGVAHISIPSNISTQKVHAAGAHHRIIESNARIIPDARDIKQAAELINKSLRPCILAGIGARDARAELLQFAVHFQAPIVKTLRGKDLLPDAHPMTLGGLGLLGTKPSIEAMNECDLLITIGTDYPYHEFYPGNAVPNIQIDNVPRQVGRRRTVSNPLVGDAKLTLLELLPLLSDYETRPFLKEYQTRMAGWLEDQDAKELSADTPIHPQAVARAISELADSDAIICCDTGAVTVWGARNFRLKGEQRFTLSGGLASMGFGLPGAIGAQLAFPEKQVIALCGDGGFAMLMGDFATAVKYKLPVKVFIFNNSKLGLIQMEEEASSGNPEFETDLLNADFAAYAALFGAEGFTVRESSELAPAIQAALRSNRACIVNVFVNKGELTLPPQVNVRQAVNYVTAKVKEYFIKA